MDDIRQLPQRACLADPARRDRYMTAMFDTIAPRYDQFTRWFSYGMDRRWKQALVQDIAAAHPQARTGLDLACGTGDLACALADAIPSITVQASDIAPTMLACARPHARVRYAPGDAMALAAAPASVDVITIGYGLRNVPDHRRVLAQVHRALVPGGVLGILDFTRPAIAPWRWTFLSYLATAGRAYGWWWHRHGPVYGYIAGSIARFVTRAQLLQDLAQAGLRPRLVRSHLGGGVAVITACRPS